jgi:hypothetical protein
MASTFTIKRSLAALAVAILVLWIWNSPWFKKLVFPQAYWKEQIEGYEFNTNIWRSSLASCHLDLLKLQRNFDIDVQQETLTQRMIPMTYSETPAQIVQRKYREAVENCRFTQQFLNDVQVQLNDARVQLKKASN